MSFKKIIILILIFVTQFFSKSVFALQTSSYTLGQVDVNGAALSGATITNSTYTADRTLWLPQGISLDTVNHRLYVADTNLRRVLVFNLNSSNVLEDRVADYVIGQLTLYSNVNTVTRSVTPNPTSVLYVPSLDMLFVGDFGSNRVLVFANMSTSLANGMDATYVLGQPDFTSSTALATSSATASGLAGPASLAYDTVSKTLFVADSSNSRVVGYDLSSGPSTGMSASYVLGQASLSGATTGNCTTAPLSTLTLGVAVDSTGRRVFVSNYTCHRVMVYDISSSISNVSASLVLGQCTTTGSVAALALSSGCTGTGMSQPWGLTFDGTNNRLFVNDLGYNRTLVYDTASITNGELAQYAFGQSSLSSGSSAAANSDGTGLGGPIASTYDEAGGYLYIVNYTYHRVMVYGISGGITGNNMAATNILGQLDSSNLPVYNQTTVANSVVSANGMSAPLQTVIDTVNHYMFVADATNNRVLIYALDSSNNVSSLTPVKVLGQSSFTSGTALSACASSTSAAALNSPQGLAWDAARSLLFVANYGGKRVTVFDLSAGVPNITNGMAASYVFGKAALTTTCTGSASSTVLAGPVGLAYDATNTKLYVSDYDAHRVAVYDLSSSPSASWNGMAISNILGQTTTTGSSASLAANRMNIPYQVLVDSTNSRLFVADSNNNRVLVFSTTSMGATGDSALYAFGQTDLVSNTAATSAVGLRTPRGIALDSSSNTLFVADNANHRILSYDLSNGITGNGMTAFAQIGQSDFTTRIPSALQTGMYNPSFLTYDNDNKRLYVSQVSSNRIDSFDVLNFSRTQPNGTRGTAYSGAISNLTSVSNPAFFLVSGSLPTGVSINGSDFTGTPTVSATYSFVLRGQTFLSDPSTYTFTIDDSITTTTTITRRNNNTSVVRVVPVIGGVSGSSSNQNSVPSPSVTTNTSTVFNNGVNITGYAVATKPDFSDSIGIVPFSFGTQKNLTIPRKSVIQYIKFYSSTGDATQPVVVPAVEKNITTSCSYTRTLSIGSRGNDVRCIQEKLGIKNDGIFGKQVSSTIKSYQKKKGVKQTGVVDKKLWNMIVR